MWAHDADFMQRQPGFNSTQLHRGAAGSSTLINVAVWESAAALRNAFTEPEFQARLSQYPDGTITSPHLFTKVAVRGICDGDPAQGRVDGPLPRRADPGAAAMESPGGAQHSR